MRLILIGYGKMGKMIEEVALERKHTVVLKLTSKDKWDATTLQKCNADVAIEFTGPECAYQNILNCFDANLPVVVGTTGWYQHLQEVKNICLQKNQSLLYASNFSIGVNLFFKINEMVAEMMHKYTAYDVSILEVHHTQKKDAPSGTAITLAEIILKYYPEKSKWTNTKNQSDLYIQSHRCGDEKGFHTVHYQSAIDAITLSHQAYSRKGFAIGAVMAAEFLKGKKGVFTMQDVLNI